MTPSNRLRICHVVPHPWGDTHESVNFVAEVAPRLAAAGHDVVIAAPSDSRAAIRASKSLVTLAARNPEVLFDGTTWTGVRAGAGPGAPPVLSIGSRIPLPRGPQPRIAPVAGDAGPTIERLLVAGGFDIVHVHDPFAPGLASAALRNSWSLNVGSFHEPTERVLSTQVARPLVDIFFGRLDARTVACGETRELMTRFFSGTYDDLRPGADVAGAPWWPGSHATAGAGENKSARIAYVATEEKGALRLFLRALRRLPTGSDWRAAVWVPEGVEVRPGRAIADRVDIVGAADCTAAELVAGADILVGASTGGRAAPQNLRTALANGTAVVGSWIPAYRELLDEGSRGLLFQPGDAITLAGQLGRLVDTPAERSELAQSGRDEIPAWDEVVNRVGEIYERLTTRRHPIVDKPAIRKRLAGRPLINVDLHMHTDHSSDCATSVTTLLETARDRGLGAIAVTDHNEVSGAFAARELSEQIGGPKIIIGEEVMTAEQGEVIGLFLTELIPRGMTMAETITEIRRQGGLVYVPHPFDRLHSVPDYEHLLDIVEDIDIIEVFNPRVAMSSFNEEAKRFSAKYRIVAGAGSDSHVAQGLGSVMIRMHDFDGPEEFLESMRASDLVRLHKNLVYVQTLKFLQTSGGRGGRRTVAAP